MTGNIPFKKMTGNIFVKINKIIMKISASK